jgi:hypothetical protein
MAGIVGNIECDSRQADTEQDQHGDGERPRRNIPQQTQIEDSGRDAENCRFHVQSHTAAYAPTNPLRILLGSTSKVPAKLMYWGDDLVVTKVVANRKRHLNE